MNFKKIILSLLIIASYNLINAQVCGETELDAQDHTGICLDEKNKQQPGKTVTNIVWKDKGFSFCCPEGTKPWVAAIKPAEEAKIIKKPEFPIRQFPGAGIPIWTNPLHRNPFSSVGK